jgi:hypothetical protein
MSGETLTIAPMVDLRLIATLGFICLVFVLIGLIRNVRGGWLRLIVLSVLVAALINPRFVRELRDAQNDVAVIVVDRTASQNVGTRKNRTDSALKDLRQRLQAMETLDVREVEVFDGTENDQHDGLAGDGSNLVTALNRVVGDIPKGRYAGAVMITDGQVHDAGDTDALNPSDGPLHVVLSGLPDESDRRLVIDNAPGYGIVGQDVSITYHVEDKSSDGAKTGGSLAKVTLHEADKIIARSEIQVGQKDTFTFPLNHAGPSILEIHVEPAKGELSDLNNRTLININGVRDRLKVLLVSGHPHAGERTWRNLLKADPSVDLVHFTILRPPEKNDFTPLNELALIAFPVRELFEVKLNEFDLVVFDRYILRDILPPSYIQNIADYVNDGGAMLLSVGPEFASTRSLSETPLSKILPARPTGEVLERSFRADISSAGHRHPVTAGLASRAPINRANPGKPGWGRWFRQIEATVDAGSVLMTGLDKRPLLVLNRQQEGRVALMLSDQIWLWARGYDGGGPQAELLRRMAHWLMKEPDLEEESLRATVKGGELHIRRRSLSEKEVVIEVTSPSGKVIKVSGETDNKTDGNIVMPANEVGLYKISDGIREVRAASGSLNPLEFSDLRTTPEHMKDIVRASGGDVFWAQDGMPDLRRIRPGRNASGRGWVGFLENQSYVVTGVRQLPVLPGLVSMVLLLVLLMAAWWREGR